MPDIYTLLDSKTLLPQDLDVPVPRFGISDNPSITRRNDLFRLLVERYNLLGTNGSCFDTTHALAGYIPGRGTVEESAIQQTYSVLTLDDAILLIQRAERGRAARLRAKLVQDIMKVRPAGKSAQGVRIQTREQAVVCIQKFWRRALARRRVAAMRQAEALFLGLVKDSDQAGKQTSIFPLVGGLLGPECSRMAARQREEVETRIRAMKEALEQSILNVEKPGVPDSGIARSLNVATALTPLSAIIPAMTCDGMESTYALTRYIDKANIVSHQPYMADLTNAYDSGLPIQHASVRERVLLSDAERLVGDDYKAEQLAKRRAAARIQAERTLKVAEETTLKELFETEGVDLRKLLLERHSKAISQFQDLNEGALPTVPLDVATPDEKLVMDKVLADRAAELLRRGGKGKKGKKGKKPPAKSVETVEVEDPNKDKVAFLSSYLAGLVDATADYFTRWQRYDSTRSSEQPYDIEYLKEELRPGVFTDVYTQVAEEVAADLENKRAIAVATKQLVEAKKGKGSKGKKGKRGKKGKKGGKGAPLDDLPPCGPVGEPLVEAAYAELVSEGLIKAIKPARMRDFVGCDTFFTPSSQETQFIQTVASKALEKFAQSGQVAAPPPQPEASPSSVAPPDLPSYNLIKQYLISGVILPLACPLARAVPHPNSLLIYGAPGTGKTLLARILATETGALFIDVSPSNIVGKFPGQEIGVIFKLIKQVIASNQPAIIYFDEAELVLADTKEKKGTKGKGKGKKGKAGKLPGDDAATPGYSMCCDGYPKTEDPLYNPYRLRKELLSLAKSINEYDGVLILGVATRTMTREKALADYFQQHVYIPLPDYNTRLQLISHFFTRIGLREFGLTGVGKDALVPYALSSKLSTTAFDARRFTALGLLNLTSGMALGAVENGFVPFDLNSLAKVTEGYTAGQIFQLIHEVCSPGRVSSFSIKPLNIMEFTDALAKIEPQYDSQVAHFNLYKLLKKPPAMQQPGTSDAAPPAGKK